MSGWFFCRSRSASTFRVASFVEAIRCLQKRVSFVEVSGLLQKRGSFVEVRLASTKEGVFCRSELLLDEPLLQKRVSFVDLHFLVSSVEAEWGKQKNGGNM